MKEIKDIIVATIVGMVTLTYLGCASPSPKVNPIDSCRNMCLQGTVEFFKEGITECRCKREESDQTIRRF